MVVEGFIMKIWEISGKNVRITLTDGKIFSGLAERNLPS